MPTTRQRHILTETPEIERRLDKAARAFPALAGDRKRLLVMLTEVAEEALDRAVDQQEAREAAKRRILARTAAITPERAEEMLIAREADWQQDFEA